MVINITVSKEQATIGRLVLQDALAKAKREPGYMTRAQEQAAKQLQRLLTPEER